MKKILIVFWGTFSLMLLGQTLSSQLSKNTLRLGEVGVFTLRISNLDHQKVEAPAQNQLLPASFEELSDSIARDKEAYVRQVKFQVFEAGVYKIPPIEVKVGNKILSTIPYRVAVVNTAKQGDKINDIKGVKKVELGWGDYWSLYKNYIISFIAIILVLVLGRWLYKFIKKRKEPRRVATYRTLKELEILRKKGYIDQQNYRSFYVELIDIIRRFLAERYHFPARELLTDDLIDYMRSHQKLSKEDIDLLDKIFNRGDLTKFAKAIPGIEDMKNDWQQAKSFVKRSYQEEENPTHHE